MRDQEAEQGKAPRPQLLAAAQPPQRPAAALAPTPTAAKPPAAAPPGGEAPKLAHQVRGQACSCGAATCRREAGGAGRGGGGA